jgi:predicted phosphoribosyltransferase
MSTIFKDRAGAGRKLARKLGEYEQRKDAVVLALPRGGVVVGFEVAMMLGLPLEAFVVRKICAPARPDVAVGAIAPGGVTILDERLILRLGISDHEIVDEANAQRLELERQARAYCGREPMADLFGKVVILVDDAVATGATMKAAIEAVRRLGADRVVVAVPAAPAAVYHELRQMADEVVCLEWMNEITTATDLFVDFESVSDEQVQDYLAEAEALMRLQHCTLWI